ncbi:hypothetical protein GCM10010329_80660 [Streptomyces spiroverticillatus]|uniref:Uncharacterized protein n=1 Tax=Streptomyces finlayi TaxID=67296 RepID=A0A918X6U2_9ACTN|nr:hypothetical protein [Streptomyces finlayi]GHA45928.1 hypothetical protein GCM10010329_80660 [Streptomyces spiroverticillatus]GHD15988.1 hypothetical protein GCM10010334_76580 [Streptomyces finlayi]
MPTRHSLIDYAAARFGWRRAYDDRADVEALLTAQTQSAYAQAADHVRLATEKNTTELAVQPAVLDIRGRLLDDLVYLDGVLTGARNRGLAPDLIARLEDAVRNGQEQSALLAAAARATTARAADH